MGRLHTLTLKRGTKTYEAAIQTLVVTLVTNGSIKSGYTRFSDMSDPKVWQAYQRARIKLGLTKTRG